MSHSHFLVAHSSLCGVKISCFPLPIEELESLLSVFELIVIAFKYYITCLNSTRNVGLTGNLKVYILIFKLQSM